MTTKTRTGLSALIMIAITALFSLAVFADPEGPDNIDRGLSETKSTNAGVVQQAEGGNVTPLIITHNAQTQRWQGFYGNITGNLTLDDAAGNTLYQWVQADPQGEIYAVNGSTAPIWTNITCVNLSESQVNTKVSQEGIESTLGLAIADPDGVNETFNSTFSGSFNVGDITIAATDSCPHVSLNVDDAADESNFNEVILSDNTSDHNVIYTTIIETNQNGFQTGSTDTFDFQMIVGEDGETAGATNYYFYVELS